MKDSVRKSLQVNEGDVVAFCLTQDDKILVQPGTMGQQIKELLGANSVRSQNIVTIPEKLRDLLKLSIGDLLFFFLEPDGTITLEG